MSAASRSLIHRNESAEDVATAQLSAMESAWIAQNAVAQLHLAIVTANAAREMQIEYGEPWPAQWPATLLSYAEDARALAELFEAAAKAAGG